MRLNLLKNIFIWILCSLGVYGSAIAGMPCGVDVKDGSKLLILFVNGIKNTTEDACQSSADLKSGLEYENVDTSKVDFSYFHNNTNGLWGGGDISELRKQATLSDMAIRDSFGFQDIYYQKLASNYKFQYTIQPDQEIIKTTQRLYDRLVEITTTGKKRDVIVVPHSQGNFYVEAAYALLLSNGRLDVISKLRVVGVASVAKYPPGRYLTIRQDQAVYRLQNLNSFSLNYYSPASYTTSACFGACTSDQGTSVPALLAIFPPTTLLHSFSDIYLNGNLFDSSSDRSLPASIVQMIKDASSDLSAPLTSKTNRFMYDDFNGASLDSSKWSSLPCRSAGDPTFAGNGQVHFGPCQSASTQGKVTFSGKKIVIEARFAGPKGAGRDTAIALVNAATGDFFQFGDTDYFGRGIYAYLYYGGSYEFVQPYGGTTTAFKEYRVTIEGKNVTIQRGDSLSNLTETYTATLPRSATDGAYYLRIGTGTDWYAPADFDWIRVTTDATNPLNGHRYEVIDCGSWSQCQMAAVLRGGKLATIRSKAENDWIVSTLLPMSKNEWGLWIGYTNAGHEGRWTWDSGESASYTNWAPGEPNNSGGAEHYAHILNVASNPGSWNDLYENGFGYVSQAIIEYSK